MKMRCDLASSLRRWPPLAAVSLQLILLVASASSLTGDNSELALRRTLSKLCRNLNTMHHLSEMESLIETLKSIERLPINDGSPLGGIWSVDYWARSQDPAQACLEQADSILDLEPIIGERTNVCRLSHIELLEAYKRKHLNGAPGYRVTKRFFNLYANQVAFNCKHDMMRSLRTANEYFINPSDYTKVMPWLGQSDKSDCLNENITRPEQQSNTEEANFDLFNAEGESLSSVNKAEASTLRCKAIEALSNVKSILQLVEALDYDLGDGLFTDGSNNEQMSHTTRQDSKTNNLILIIPDEMRTKVKDMLETCSKFEQIYSRAILPIVRLIQLGYNPAYKRFDEKVQEDLLPQHWFSITLICNSMLRARLGDRDSQHPEYLDENRAGVIVVDEVDERNNPKSEQTTSRERQQSKAAEGLLSNPIEDELWIGKYLPGRFKRFKTKYVDQLIKVFKIDKLRESVVFKKHVERGRSLILTLIFVGLTLIGINSSQL